MRSGFTIVRNGERLGYPYLESIRSLAPLVDEIVIAVGDCDDETPGALAALAREISCPLILLASPWDSQSTKGGFELARQTNIALGACRAEVCFYLQADEVLDDAEYPRLREDLDRFAKDDAVDALALHWIHFYGNFSTVVESKQWYRREIRAVKRSRLLQSYGDAQGFRIFRDGIWTKPHAALSGAHVLHYGWVRPPTVMAKKSEALDRLWHGKERDGSHSAASVYAWQFGLKSFGGRHPAVMRERIDAFGDFDPFGVKGSSWSLRNLKLRLTALVERVTGWRPGEFRNYRSLKLYGLR